MPQPANRFQIKLDGVIKTDPENWINFTPTTERHEVYRSLLATFSEGTVRLIKTAKNYVDAAYAQYGSAQSIAVEWLEYDYASDSYEAIFALGTLNLSEKYKRERDYTEVGFEPTSFIMNVLNRDEIKTSLQELTDMDGDAITAFTDETHTVTLSNQIIDFSASYNHSANFVDHKWLGGSETTLYSQVPIFTIENLNEGIVDVLSTNVSHDVSPAESISFITDAPENQILFKEEGDVNISFNWITVDDDIKITYQSIGGWTLDNPSTVSLIYRINGGAEVVLDSVVFDAVTASSLPVSKELTVSDISLPSTVKGDVFVMYIKVTPLEGTTTPEITMTTNPETLVVQSTVFEDTDCEIMLPWEVLLRLCQKITGRNDCFRSTFFGRTDGEVHTYGSDGDGAFYSITSSKLLRGFPLASNHINASLLDIFKGFDNIALLGLGVIYESDVPYIVIERLEHFMDGTTSAATFEAAYPGIEWKSAINYVWGNVKSGYSKYKLERAPTLSSPHSPRNYSIPFLSEFTSKQYDNTCDFIASGHLIEILRRNRFSQSNKKDLPYDEDLVVIHMKRDGGGSFEKVLDENFSVITNIDNPTTSSNLHLTPARNLLRQAPLLLAGLAKRIIDTPAFTGLARIQSGDGNIEAKTRVTGEAEISENEDLNRSMAGGVYSNAPLFDASEMGVCTVTINKAQRQIIKEGLLTAITVTDNGVTYTGFIESLKEVDLEKGIAELNFLSNTGL